MVADVEVGVEAIQVADHLVVALFLGDGHDFLFRPCIGVHFPVGVLLPEEVGAIGEQVAVHHLAAEDAEHVVAPLAATAPCVGAEGEYDDAND